MAIDIAVDKTALVDGQPIDANDVLVPVTDLEGAIEDGHNGVLPFDQILVSNSQELTIASGVVTRTMMYHRVDTEGNAASDDLDSILGGAAGQLLLLELENAARLVTLRHGAGNIEFAAGENVTLSAINRLLPLFFNGNKWVDFLPTITASVLRQIVARTALGAAAASITISSIPATYKHLLAFYEIRSADGGSAFDEINLQPNSDATVSNYYSNNWRFRNTSASTQSAGGVNGVRLGHCPAGLAPSGYKGIFWVWIPNYFSTSAPRHMVCLAFTPDADSASGMALQISGGTWKNTTDAISSLKLLSNNGFNIDTGSAYSLYGVQ